MLAQFFRLVYQINDGQSTIDEAAAVLSSLMTDDEHLALLQGNRSLIQHLSDNKASPYPASVLPRIGVPGFHIVDAPRQSCLTEFTSPLGRAASFNPHLEELIGQAIGLEVRNLSGNVYSGICLHVTRRQDWARAHESYGEDPLVVSLMSSAVAKGVRKYAMVAVRHFPMNRMGMPLPERSFTMDEKTCNEFFLKQMKEVLCESGAEMVVVPADNINGVPCTETPAVMKGIFRQRWQLNDLLVASDCTYSVKNGVASIKAGLDIEMQFNRGGRVAAVEKALEHDLLDWSEIQVMTNRIIKAQLRYHCRTISVALPSMDKLGHQQHIDLARRSVAESIVLLKNDNKFLPFKKAAQIKMTILGESADKVSSVYRLDEASYAEGPSGTSPLEELRKSHNVSVDYLDGNNIGKAKKSAMTADCVLMFIRASSESEHEPESGSFFNRFKNAKQDHSASKTRDRSYLTLHARDLGVAKAVLSVADRKVVVIIEAGPGVTIPAFIRQKATSILFSSYCCRKYGKGLRDVLFGEREPSGRLPFVLPDTEQQLLQPEIDTKSQEIRYDDQWGYRKLQCEQQKPAYPFGFGLGYSTFTLNSLRCSRPITQPTFVMTVKATNTGNRTSAVVVQIYASRTSRRDSALPGIVPRVLIGFAKEVILPGESTEIGVNCRLSPLAEFSKTKSQMIAAEGQYEILACQHEGDTKALSTSVRVSDEVCC
ncbi:hypothetical protein QM012_009427 [Aureobasidium pullulans]|uniref:beta-glucosidase n=1 Tax=Aureobasidium pullulans TaxID=5580 RepID=A0ABR0THX0_AURPU